MSTHGARLPLATLLAGLALAALLGLSLGFPARLLPLIRPHVATHRLDGRVEPGEYSFRWADEASQLEFAWSIVGDRLLGAVTSPDTGWVAVGFGASGPLMYGSDIVIGYVDARGAHLRDHFATEATNHQPDTALGGHDDVLAGAGTQTEAGTTIEFERPLAGGAHDSTDRAISAGQLHMMAASAEADDFSAYHMGGRKAVTLLDPFAGPPATTRATLLPDHLNDVQIFLAAWAALLLLMGIHGLAAAWAERGAGSPEVEAGPAVAGVAALLILEVAGVATFAVGILVAAPAWLLGLALAVGLLALSGLIIVHSRSSVSFALTRHERDDGIPW